MNALPTFSIPAAIARLLALLLLAPCAQADIKVIPGKKRDKDKIDEKRLEQVTAMTPEAKPAQVSFVAGRSVDVELDAAAVMVSDLRFFIRQAPRHGTLSAIRPHPTERHKAVVTYTHTGGEENLMDEFSYACRVGEGPFSAPGKVALHGRRAEPRLAIIRQAFFDRVLPGTQAMAKVTVTNNGIGPFKADLTWPHPWQGPPRLELDIGETAELALMVTPQRPGVLSDELTLQEGNEASRVRLWLQCEQPFIVTPGRAQMEYDRERGQRWVKARVANATKEPLRLKLVLPERLQGPAEIEVPASQLKEVELTLADEDVEAFLGDVLFTDGVLSERLTLGASPEPPQVKLVAPSSGVLQFGSRHQGETGKASVVVTNRGGMAAVLAIQAPPPFRVPEEEKSLSVGPGMTRQMVLEVFSAKAGKYQGKIVLSGDGNRLELEAQASFVDPNVMQMKSGAATVTTTPGRPVVAAGAPAAAAGKVARPKAEAIVDVPPDPDEAAGADAAMSKPPVGPAPVKQENAVTALGKVNTQAAAVLSYLSVFGAPVPEEQLSKKYGKISGIEVAGRGKDFLDLVWEQPDPDSPPQSYQVEGARQVLVPSTGMFFRDWQPMPEVKPLAPGKGKAGVRLAGLSPAGQYEVRVMAVDERGKVSPPSDIYILNTLPPWRMPGWVWYAGALFLLGVLLVTARRLYLKRMGLSFA